MAHAVFVETESLTGAMRETGIALTGAMLAAGELEAFWKTSCHHVLKMGGVKMFFTT